MNKPPLAKRTQILAMLCGGSSMRSISRITDVSINTVSKLLVQAGEACLAIHDETVRNVKASRVQCDEIWSFCYAKEKQAKLLKARFQTATLPADAMACTVASLALVATPMLSASTCRR
jgi:lambda repressor-like predicted transcriptional regulator